MAATSATISPATLAPASAANILKRKPTNFIVGLNSFGGLKAQNKLSTLGLPKSTDHFFSLFANSMRASMGSRKGKGGALSSTCNAAAEIFKIAAIMNGLVLVGVAVGFVLLRIEASVEEAE
ncbi:hypothetical protein AMTRI_Chr13g124890 [Amborella trichopoda]